jgi:thiol-disulfide isomerase/thioredoxin
MRQFSMRDVPGFSFLFNRRTQKAIWLLLAAGFFILLIPCLPAVAAEDFDALYDEASFSYRQGNYQKALIIYKRANSFKKEADPECLYGIAQSYEKLGEFKSVHKICDQLMQISGENIGYKAKAWKLRGDAIYATAITNSKPDEAKLRESETAYREALKINPAMNQAHYQLAIALIRMNRINEGLRELQIFIKNADDGDAREARKIIEKPGRALENYAPDFSVVTLDGERVSSDELRGKIVLLDFWGIWCRPCLNEIPFLKELSRKTGKEKFVLLSVDVRDEEAQWRSFVQGNEMNWMQAQDKNSQIQRAFSIRYYPSYILIDHDGIIRYQGKGAGTKTEKDINVALKKALKTAEQSGPANLSVSPAPPDLHSSQATAEDDSMSVASPALRDAKLFAVRIPKPRLNSKNIKTVLSPGARIQSYMLQVQNWASFPEELFEPASDLPPCSQDRIASSRLEMTVLNEEDKVLMTTCGMTKPESLQAFPLTISGRSGVERVRVQMKDRLTGDTVQSAPLRLW